MIITICLYLYQGSQQNMENDVLYGMDDGTLHEDITKNNIFRYLDTDNFTIQVVNNEYVQ